MFKRMRKISCSDFWVLSHERLSDFYTSGWQRGGSPLPLLFFRLLLATASVGFLVWSLTSGQSGLSPLWLIYLTNWGLVMVAAMAVGGFLVSAMAAHKKPGKYLESTKNLYRKQRKTDLYPQALPSLMIIYHSSDFWLKVISN